MGQRNSRRVIDLTYDDINLLLQQSDEFVSKQWQISVDSEQTTYYINSMFTMTIRKSKWPLQFNKNSSNNDKLLYGHHYYEFLDPRGVFNFDADRNRWVDADPSLSEDFNQSWLRLINSVQSRPVTAKVAQDPQYIV